MIGAGTRTGPATRPASPTPTTRTTRTCSCSPTASPAVHADVPLGSHRRPGPRRGAELPARARRRRPVARLPRVHARAHEPAGHGRAGLRRAERGAGRGDRRGHGRLVRARLPGRATAARSLRAGRRERPGRDAWRATRWTAPPACARRRSTARWAQNDPPARAPAAAPAAGGYTYGDFAKIRGGAEAHDDGEIWAQTLWQLRERLIAVHGSALGITRAAHARDERACGSSPPNPSFLDMRNAILLADEQPGINGGDRALIWSVFAQPRDGLRGFHRRHRRRAPAPGLHRRRPAPATPVGSVAGTVRDLNTGAPLAGALVAFAGPRQRTGRGPVHAHGGQRQLPHRPGARRARGSFLTVARGRRLRPRRGMPNVAIAARRGRHAQLHAPAQLGAGLRRRRPCRSFTGPDFATLRLRPALGDRRHSRSGLEHALAQPARPARARRSW